jgi:glyoxylase I family protein
VDVIRAGRVDHVGITVPDLTEAVRFFVDVLGFQELYSHTPSGGRGDVQARQFDRHPDTEIVGIAMLRLDTVDVELLEFRAPDQRRDYPRTSDWGGAHLALYVDDLDTAVEHLRAQGVDVLGEPMALPGPESGPGNRFVFALGPGRMPVELISYPAGKAYGR